MTPRAITLWFVHGFACAFLTKLDAEVFARKKLPEESEDARYARIYCQNYVNEKELT